MDTEEFLRRIRQGLVEACGLDLSGYREGTLQRRVSVRVAAAAGGDREAYLHLLERDPGEWDRLVDAVTIHVSGFFRDPVVFELLARDVLPELIERRRPSHVLRVWSAGCAAGQEPYSVAILLDRALRDERADWSCLIFATDLARARLETARQGVYPRAELEHARLGVVDAYFTAVAGGYELRPAVREMVQFSQGDVVSPGAIPTGSIYGSFDLVLCRNVLIYYGAAAQQRALDQLRRSLAPGGYLVLGEAEALDDRQQGALETIHQRARIYRRPPARAGTGAQEGLFR